MSTEAQNITVIEQDAEKLSKRLPKLGDDATKSTDERICVVISITIPTHDISIVASHPDRRKVHERTDYALS